jgi:hypothetical protein
MLEIQNIISLYYRNKINGGQSCQRLGKLPKRLLAEFILDAFNRGWITKFNLGLNEDGDII